MPQKKSTTKKTAPKKASVKKAQQRPGERAPLMLRLPKGVHEVIAKAAEEAGISMSLLTEGLLDACTKRLVPGRPVKRRIRGREVVVVEEVPGCFFCGVPGQAFYAPPETAEEEAEMKADWASVSKPTRYVIVTRDPDEIGLTKPGIVWFALDYSSSPVRFGDE